MTDKVDAFRHWVLTHNRDNYGRYDAFAAGATWQREQDAKLADERKLMRLRLAEEHANKDGQYYNHVRAQEASDIADEIRAQGSKQEGSDGKA